jgi:hypothetical protein
MRLLAALQSWHHGDRGPGGNSWAIWAVRRERRAAGLGRCATEHKLWVLVRSARVRVLSLVVSYSRVTRVRRCANAAGTYGEPVPYACVAAACSTDACCVPCCSEPNHQLRARALSLPVALRGARARPAQAQWNRVHHGLREHRLHPLLQAVRDAAGAATTCCGPAHLAAGIACGLRARDLRALHLRAQLLPLPRRVPPLSHGRTRQRRAPFHRPRRVSAIRWP